MYKRQILFLKGKIIRKMIYLVCVQFLGRSGKTRVEEEQRIKFQTVSKNDFVLKLVAGRISVDFNDWVREWDKLGLMRLESYGICTSYSIQKFYHKI